MSEWFTTDKADDTMYIISEYRHPEETHCYLLIGADKCLLIDTGLGIGNIYNEVSHLTDKPVITAATHVHWDHIGGHKYFPCFYVHEKELDWLNGSFPLPVEAVRKMLTDNTELPKDFDAEKYSVFQGKPARALKDHDMINLGGRSVEVLHTPGHSPGHMCFWEKETGYLFTGDLVYKGTLFAYYPSTDPEAYLRSLEKIAALPTLKVFPAHHSLDISPEIIIRMRNALRELKEKGLLHHGSGTFEYGDWAVRL